MLIKTITKIELIRVLDEIASKTVPYDTKTSAVIDALREKFDLLN